MANIFRLPDIGEGLTEAEIIEWFVEVGGSVDADQPMVAVETDKTQVELPAPVAGVLLHQGAGEGTILAVGSVLAVIGEPGETWNGGDGTNEEKPEPDQARPGSFDPSSPAYATTPTLHRPLALPIVRKRAKEAGIDLADVRGTGPEGRITRGDLDSHLARPAGTERPPLVGTLVETAEDLSSHTASTTTGREVRLSPTRRAIADRLSRSWSEIPHVTTYDSFDASRILQARRDLSVRLGRKVPIEALMIKAIVPALRAHPEFNATLRDDILTLHDLLDIGIAVDGGDGLLVAVARSVDELSIGDLATEIDRLVGAARSRSLSRQDATGATFTLSNIGAVGGGFGTPLIPLGTTAILSLGRASDAAVARDGAVAIAPMAPLSLSYDHRVIDGALGRQFMAMVTENLTDPIHVPK